MSPRSRITRGAAAAALLALGACSGGPDLSPGALVSGGRDVAAEQRTAELYAPVAACPQVSIRAGTQTYPVYEPGRENDPAGVRFQATIARTARDCTTDQASGDTRVRVGVSGRVLSGPSGATGSVTLPVRVALIANGSDLIYSTLHEIPATVTAEQPSVQWSYVDQSVVIPAANAGDRLELYVGFDAMGR